MVLNHAQLQSPTLVKNQSFRNVATYSRLCSEAVRLFYVNLRHGPGSDRSFFTTLVVDYEIKVSPDLLVSVLDLPHSGHQAGTNRDFYNLGFCFDEVLESLAYDIGRWFPSQISAGRLPDNLKHMIKSGIEYYGGPLTFGPQITQLLYRLEGVSNPELATSLVNAAVAAFKQEASSRSGSKRKMMLEKDLMLPKYVYESNQISDLISPDSDFGDEDNISSYASPHSYPF
ncbi:unnamed protein product [Linum trigynum]|uniref:Uncharacterized protein n=1 Tax=Linum trigynum TaxID=586398 RepID=A0AAV2F764_9ROSI